MSSICIALMGLGLCVGCDDVEPTDVRLFEARLDTGDVPAVCEPGPPSSWRAFADDGELRTSFRQRPGTRCRFELPIPAHARLQLALSGVERSVGRRSGASVSVAVLRDGERRVVLRERVDPGRVVTVESLDLGEAGGDALELIHEGARGAASVDWTDAVLTASFADADPPPGWRRPTAVAVDAFAADVGCPAPRAGKRRLLVLGIDGASWPLLDELIAGGHVPRLADLARRGLRGRLESTFVPESAMAWTSIRTGVTPGRHGVHHFLSRDAARWSYWKWLDEAGLRSVVIGVPKSSPLEPGEAVLVGGWDLDAEHEYTRPPALAAHLAEARYDPAIANVADAARFAAKMRERTDLALALLARCDWDHAFVVYEYSDTAGHRFGLHSDGWRTAYTALDREIGRLLAAQGSETSVLVVSDHGWRRFERAFAIEPWLVENGFSDWKPHIYGGHRVALRPEARLEPAAETRAIASLRDALLAVRDPVTGAPVVARVLPFAEGLPGPYGESSPLRAFVELERDYKAAGKQRGGPVWSDGAVDHHDIDGVWLLVDPGVGPGLGRDASVVDVAPTVAAFFGVTPPADLDGQPLVELAPVRPRTSTPAVGTSEVREEPELAPPPPSPELREHLRSLGYVDEEG